MLLVFGLFIVPKALQRFRLPGAVTCLAIGAALNIGFHLFHEDHTVKLLATLGIVSMAEVAFPFRNLSKKAYMISL